MNRVKVHPHRTYVKAGEKACVSVTADRPRARAYYMGMVMLADVEFRIHQSGVKRAQEEQQRNVHAWAVGTLLEESIHQHAPMTLPSPHMVKVTYHYNVGRFMTVEPKPVDVTDKTFNAAVFVGPDLYVSR